MIRRRDLILRKLKSTSYTTSQLAEELRVSKEGNDDLPRHPSFLTMPP